MSRKTIACICGLVLIAGAAGAYQGKPPRSDDLNVVGVDHIAHQTLRPVDIMALFEDDAAKAGEIGVPYRVAREVAVDFSPAADGTWEDVADGARLWRLRVSSPRAVFLSFLLKDFELPWGAELRFVSVDREHFVGPYTLRNNNELGIFRSPAVAGDSAFLELYLPAGVEAPGFRVAAVSHGYRDFNNYGDRPMRPGRALISKSAPAPRDPFAKALPCEVDVNCPEGNNWQDDKRAVARTFDGTFLCTGVMLNNVRGDCRNLFLTANHCTKSKGKAAGLVFHWNFENTGCSTGDATLDDSTTGSTLLDTSATSDFTIVELTEAPPASFGVYHAGWNNVNSPASSAVTIHHPNADEKKISFEFDPVVEGEQSGWGNDHWRVTGWDIGTTEGGSSGGGLWNGNHEVVGQLHGGTGDCDGGWDEYGKLAVSWGLGADAILDPDATGATSLAGLDCSGGPGEPPPPCDLGRVGDPCTADAECCSNSCKGKPGSQTCK